MNYEKPKADVIDFNDLVVLAVPGGTPEPPGFGPVPEPETEPIEPTPYPTW